MKLYFASRTKHREKIIEISKYLEAKGKHVVSGWIHDNPPKPFHENINESQKLANKVVASILDTDIFILVSDPEGTDMFVELGICLAKTNLVPESIKIYIIGEHSKRSIMQLHPSINTSKNTGRSFR